MRRALLPLLCLLLLGTARDAAADATAFLGINHTPANRPARGVAVNLSLLAIGFEFEYSESSENVANKAPALRSAMFNLMVLTPRFAGVRAYGTAGGGAYQERLGERKKTNIGTNVGGGAVVPLFAALGLRLDYRLFALRGGPLHARVQRVYVGANIAF